MSEETEVIAERKRCEQICQVWLDNFSAVEINHTSARQYATDTVNDILDLIRSGAEAAT